MSSIQSARHPACLHGLQAVALLIAADALLVQAAHKVAPARWRCRRPLFSLLAGRGARGVGGVAQHAAGWAVRHAVLEDAC